MYLVYSHFCSKRGLKSALRNGEVKHPSDIVGRGSNPDPKDIWPIAPSVKMWIRARCIPSKFLTLCPHQPKLNVNLLVIVQERSALGIALDNV